MIKKLAEASQAGVQITMNIRGICCILPGVEGITDNLEIVAIVGRYLEHTRIFSFGTGDEQKMYISSADLMTRNLDRRVEVACPIYDPEVKKEINKIIEITLSDNVKTRKINSKGDYYKIFNGKAPMIAQNRFISQALEMDTYEPAVKKSIFERIRDFFGY